MNLLPSTQQHYWVDNLDPWIVHFSGNVGIRWYGLSYAAGILVAAWLFCFAYGVGRFIDEFWRQPDFGQPVYWGWMSKGQLLTIPIIVIGIFLAIRQFQQGAVPKG